MGLGPAHIIERRFGHTLNPALNIPHRLAVPQQIEKQGDNSVAIEEVPGI
jgi:hypothetical protein